MTRCILALTFTAMALSAQTASAWEALDNFVDDLVACCTFDTGPAIDYGPPPAIYTPPPEPPVPPPVVVPMAAAPAPCPPPPAPACCEPCDCCEQMKGCWQKWCASWKAMCAKCFPASTGPAFAPPPVGPPPPSPWMSGIQQPSPYGVAYPPVQPYEAYSDGPALNMGPHNMGPTFDYGPPVGTTSAN